MSQQLSTVSSYVVDLKRVKKSGGSLLPGVAHNDQPAAEPKDPKGSVLRRSYERPSTGCSSQRYHTQLSSGSQNLTFLNVFLWDRRHQGEAEV